MGARGRKSADAVALSAVVVQGNFGKRPEAPAELTPEQALIWTETVASESLEQFGTAATKAMLKDYCRHRADAERYSAVIDSFKADWLKTPAGLKQCRDLAKLRDQEVRSAAALARALRLTNQSRYTPGAAATASKRAAAPKMPWEFDGED